MIIIIFILTCSLYAKDTTQTAESSGNLILIVRGMENNNGFIRTALANSREIYEQKTGVYKSASLPIENLESEYIFEGIPFGEYAFKVFHDENSNEKLDFSFLGFPLEAYGFSNDASGLFGPPDWDKAKFLFSGNEQVVIITVQ